jgi:hypothetical protein
LKKYLSLIGCMFLLVTTSFSQVISGVHVYEPSNSKFTDYDLDPQGKIYFGGYVRPHNASGADTIGNITYDGYWYEDGMTCSTDSTGFIDWINITGSYDGLEDTRSIRYWNGDVYSAGNFISQAGTIYFNGVAIPFQFPCCYNGYLMRQSENGIFDWLFDLQYDVYDMEMDNSGNCYVTESGAMKKINSLGSQVWSVNIGFIGSDVFLHNDTIYLLGTFQDSVNIGGNIFVAYGPQYDVDMYLARYSASSGNFIDATHIGSTTWDVPHDIAADANGNVWISGITGDAALWGTDILPGAGRRIFFTKVNNDLSSGHCDVLSLISPGSEITGEMIFNSNNERIATLNIADSVIIGSDTLSFHEAAGYEGGCVIVKWDAAGNTTWHKVLASPSNGSTDVAWVSAHLRKQLNGKYLLAGQMRQSCIIEGANYDTINYYQAFFASLSDTTFNLGVPQLSRKDPELIFQNPVTDKLVITGNEIANSITIYNMIGEEVYRIKPSGTTSSIDVSRLSTGGYFFRYEGKEKMIQKKFIKYQ